MRILVTGANGQVGYELLRALVGGCFQGGSHPPQSPFLRKGEERHPPPQEEGRASARGDAQRPCEIIPATRNGECDFPLLAEKEDGLNPSPLGRGEGVRVRPCEVLDLADFDGLTRTLDRIAPDVILNAAAYTAVDKAEDEPELAQRINGDALGVLGAWAQRRGARVVHYSTDYVFDGSARKPYREDDATHPVSAYGRSKLAGELALRDSGARHLIFRTAWVYAERGKNFLRTMLRLGAERDELRVVDDQIGAPTPAQLIADVTVQALAQWLDDATPARDGLYHLVASGEVSWCGFARAIFARTIPLRPPSPAKGEGKRLLPGEGGRAQRGWMPPRVIAIATADYPTRAARPAYSVLDTARLRATFGVELPDWQAGLDGVIGELAAASVGAGT